MSFFIGALKIIFLLGFLIFIHEGAHFLVAKKCNIEIREFSIGFGPKIFQKCKDNIIYTIRAIPLGGYVDMNDDYIDTEKLKENNKSGKEHFLNASKSKRFAIAIAGIIVNLVFGLTLYFGIQIFTPVASTVIDGFVENYEENLSSLQINDKIVSINGKKIRIKQDIDYALYYNENEEIDVTIERNNEIKTVTVPLTKLENEETGAVYYRLGVKLKKLDFNINTQVYNAFWKTIYYIRDLGINIKMLFSGGIDKDSMVGPIGISGIIIESNGIYNFLYLMSVISISLGITNLLPIPGLDGGKLFFIIVEVIRRKPLNRELEAQIQLLGFSFLLFLSIYIAINDITRFF